MNDKQDVEKCSPESIISHEKEYIDGPPSHNGSPLTPLRIISNESWPHLPDRCYMVIWVFLSCSISLFNKWLMDGQFACFLTALHLAFTSILMRLLFAQHGVSIVRIKDTIVFKRIFIMAVLFSIALTTGNSANLWLSVPSIQMLKTLNPVVLLATLWMLGMKVPDGRSAACSALIVIGATSACYGSMSFNTIGLICMLVAIFTHTARMVMTQNMIDMLGEQESPAIMTLCYFAPLGAVMVGVVALVLEGPKITAAELRHVGVSQLTFSAALAFLLNLSSFDLIQRTSPFTLAMCAVVRDVILIGASTLMWRHSVTGIQMFGYSIVGLGILCGAWRKK